MTSWFPPADSVQETREFLITLPANTAVFTLLRADSTRFYFSLATNATTTLVVGFQSEISFTGLAFVGRQILAGTFTEFRRDVIGELITKDFYCINQSGVAEGLAIQECRYVLRRRENRGSNRQFIPPDHQQWRERINRFVKRRSALIDSGSTLRR